MRRIRKTAVLGSGIMGSGIACHFANIGLEVLLLDILPPGTTDQENQNSIHRNQLVNESLQKAIKSKPAPLYHKDFASRITTGNFEDDFEKIKDCDWIIEVVIERLDIKKQIFEKVDRFRKPGSLISSNTSGIPIHLMIEGRSEDFKAHFCGTHFFNPPRYLALLEIIPTPFTHSSVIDFFLDYGEKQLGKNTVLCKDTPAFIANRVGVYAMAKIFSLSQELGMTIEEVDAITGPTIGRPKTGTFRLADLVGLDTAIKVIKGIKENCPNDEQMSQMETPNFLEFLLEQNFLGNKTGKGFYEKTKEKDEKGRSVIMALDIEKLEYRTSSRPKLSSVSTAKQIDDLGRRVNTISKLEDTGGQLVKRSLAGLFAYVSNRIPEISDNLYSIDQAIKAGFAWELGPFEYWDLIGVEEGIAWAESEGEQIAGWVKDMVKAGNQSFYIQSEGKTKYFDLDSKSYQEVPGVEPFGTLRKNFPAVYHNDEVRLYDIGDQVLCLEFTSKMNAIGEGILTGINESISLAEKGDWRGIVIGNNAKNFTVGANLMLIGMMAFQQEFEQLNMAVKLFQDTTMRCRYSSIPVVAATQGYVFGGGCETIMHCDSAICAAESYIGLVEVGVGLIPGGGGTKEFALRASDEFHTGDVMIPTLLEKFKAIALASVATSAYEAFDYGYLLNSKDEVIVNKNRNIAEAKSKVLELSEYYTQPVPKEVYVLGRSGLAALMIAAHSLKLGKYASEHDINIANKIAFVLCGGDLSTPQKVSEQYLLELEREAFLSLCGEQKTLERIQHMLEKNKPLRN